MDIDSYRRRGGQAFTLIELLVVIAIIALLVSILVPSLQASREMARKAVCSTHLKNITFGINMYVNENNDVMPPWTATFAGTPHQYVQQWPDFILKYYDSVARPIPRELRPSMTHPTADAYHVANQAPPRGGNWTVNAATLNIVYAPSHNCPTQKCDTPPTPHYHYGIARTWMYNEVDPTKNDDPMKRQRAPGQGFGGTINSYKVPSAFALLCENVGTTTSWPSDNRYLMDYVAGGAVHIGRTWNFGMAGGNVKTMTDAEVLSTCPVQGNPNFPFNVPK